MARITHVKSARQRYKMVPVLNEDGTPKRTPVMKTVSVRNPETGEYEKVQRPKVTKTGREVTMAVTVQDRTQPLAPLRCDFSGCVIDEGKILPGSPYKHITPRSGPYGGTQKNRHAAHPSWQIWEYSSSRAAEVARVQADMHNVVDSWEPTDPEDFDSLKTELQEMAEGVYDDAAEALENMPEHLQDGSTAQENAEALEPWAGEFDNVSEPDADFYEDCGDCDGSGEVSEDCGDCEGTGEVEDEAEPEGTRSCNNCSGGEVAETCGACDEGKTAVVNEDWIEEARDNFREAIEESGL